jgi:hypothetical protein
MMRTSRLAGFAVVLASLLLHAPVEVGAVPCPDGAFHPLSNITCDMSADGVFNFTTVTIPAGVTVRFARNALNTFVFINATGDVDVAGAIELSAGGQTGGAGGGDGGDAGASANDGLPGTGPSPGEAGLAGTPNPGRAGGGGGMATAGGTAFRHTAQPPGTGGAPIPFPDPLRGGSGGGGGGGWSLFGVPLSGGDGGGAGGALRITTPGGITISGAIRSNGASGHFSFANAFGFGGPGGGGSGGVVDLAASAITLASTAVVQAVGGAGGGISTMPIFHPEFPSGASGGLGYLRVAAGSVALQGVVEAFLIVGADTALPINPFLCYTARTTPRTPRFVPPAPVTLANDLEVKLFDVRRPLSLCTPASKKGEGFVDPEVHLEAYQIVQKATPPQAPAARETGVKVATQFGALTLDTGRADRLLVPTAKCIDEPAGSCPDPLPAPVPATHDVEHFTCYPARTTPRTPRFTPVPGVPVAGQFTAVAGKRFDLIAPSRLCAPSDKDGEGLTNAGPRLLCFLVRAARGEPRHMMVTDIQAGNQFGTERLDATREAELCVPAVVVP